MERFVKIQRNKEVQAGGLETIFLRRIGTIFTILLIRLRIFVFKQSLSTLRATTKVEQLLFFRLSTLGGGGGGDDGKEKQHIFEEEFLG